VEGASAERKILDRKLDRRVSAPPPPRFAWSPSPAPFHSAGAEKHYRSRDASRARALWVANRDGRVTNGESLHSLLTTRCFQILPPSNRGEAERRQAQPTIVRATHADVATCMRFGRSARQRARSPVGVPPRLSPAGSRPFRSASGHASWDAVVAGVTRPCLSQSRESTSRTGRSTGRHDARSCPGADCIFPRAGTALAPHSGVPSAEGVRR
jgi:hypothetical protein